MGRRKGVPSDAPQNPQENLSTYPRWVQEKLATSGILPDTAKEAGISFVRAEEAAVLLGRDFRKHPTPEAFRIPYRSLDGKPILDGGEPYYRLRFQGEGLETSDGKRRRYYQPSGTQPHIYVPPSLTEKLDRCGVLVITEGELKALSATTHGISAAGLGGIQSYADPEIRQSEKIIAKINKTPVLHIDHTSPLHPELLEVISAVKRTGVKKILVLGDSDGHVKRDEKGNVLSGNPAVESAVKKLARAIQWQSGGVEVFRGFSPLPENPKGKMGVDDWIVEEGAMHVKASILEMCSKRNRAINFQEKAHLDLAKWYRRKYQTDGTPGLARWREDFYRWTGRRWEIVEDKTLAAELHYWLDSIPIFAGEKPVPPTRSLLEAVWATLERICHLPTAIDAPFRMSDPPEPVDSGKFLVLSNGILNVETQELFPPSIELFAPNVLPFDYNPKAACPEWEKFLGTLWTADPEAPRLLKQWAGYLLSGSTHLQKILFVIGPKRAGKGTILHVLSGLVGVENTASLSLGKLGSNFGLASLLGKSLAFFPDARLTGSTEQGPIVETLLSISGEDALPVDRKYRDVVTARIPARLVLVSNELPRLQDSSGALASRFLILRLNKSFFGEEDHGLRDRLLKELPGILNWGLSGAADLKASGKFIEPASGKELADDMHRLASPVSAFVSDCCLVGPYFRVGKTDLFNSWKRWAEENGHHAGSVEMFSRNLQAAVQVQPSRPKGPDGDRTRCWMGIGLTIGDIYPEEEEENFRGSTMSTVGPPDDSPESGLGPSQSTMSTVFGKVSFQKEEDSGNEYIEVTNRKSGGPGGPASTGAKFTWTHGGPARTGAVFDDSDIPVEDI